MKNLLSTEIATLFLDKELNIRRFTDPVTKIFKVRSEMPEPFTDLVNDLNYPDMGGMHRNVIKNLTPIQNTISTKVAGGITSGLCLIEP
jgi:two-component system CheB/CheR fusion protein